jgi:hypothetical protein
LNGGAGAVEMCALAKQSPLFNTPSLIRDRPALYFTRDGAAALYYLQRLVSN